MADNIRSAEPTDVSRRDMLRRSALVGGALVWTAPAVQTLASPAFAAGSPREENQCVVFYRFKLNVSDGAFVFEAEECGGNLPGGCVPDGYGDDSRLCPTGYNPTTGALTFSDGLVVTLRLSTDGQCATLSLPAGCQALDVDLKGGNGENVCEEDLNTVPGGVQLCSQESTGGSSFADISYLAGTFCCAPRTA